jgi:hypothetical protein
MSPSTFSRGIRIIPLVASSLLTATLVVGCGGTDETPKPAAPDPHGKEVSKNMENFMKSPEAKAQQKAPPRSNVQTK